MAPATNALVIDFLSGRDQITERMMSLEKRVLSLGKLSAQGLIPMDKTSADINNLQKQFPQLSKAINNTFKQGERAAGKFDARLLSLLFGGMALQRAFGGILRSITNTYSKAEGDTSDLRKSTTQLGAAWEFLKFSIFDVLNTDAFVNIIDGITRFVSWLSESKTAMATILFGSVSLAAIGTAMMVIGQVSLGWNSIFGVGGFLSNSNMITTKLTSIQGSLTGLATGAFIISLGIDTKKFIDGKTDFDDLLKSTGLKLAGLGAVSGNPWVIAVGITLAFLGFGEEFLAISKDLQDKSNKAFAEGNLFGGIATSFVASLAGEIGNVGVGLSEYSDGLRDAGIANQEESEVIMSTMVPALQDEKAELSEISDQITEQYITSADRRISIIERETRALLAYNQALRERGRGPLGFVSDLISSAAPRSSTSTNRVVQ